MSPPVHLGKLRPDTVRVGANCTRCGAAFERKQWQIRNHNYWCAPCRRSWQSAYIKRPDRIEKRSKYNAKTREIARDSVRSRDRHWSRLYAQRHPERAAAKHAVNDAVRTGREPTAAQAFTRIIRTTQSH